MSFSRTQSPNTAAGVSSENRDLSFTGNYPLFGLPATTVGTMNDGARVRSVIVDSMRKCPKSRAVIADEMSHLTGTKVTERMLNGYAADSKEDSRFPLELQRAFCASVGDNRLLTFGAEALGLKVIDEAGQHLMEIGRKYLLRKRSEEALADLERRLEGVEL